MAYPRAVPHAASQDTSQAAHLAPLQAAHQASPQPPHETAPQAAYQATPQDVHQVSPKAAHQDAPQTGKPHHKIRSFPAESVIDVFTEQGQNITSVFAYSLCFTTEMSWWTAALTVGTANDL